MKLRVLALTLRTDREIKEDAGKLRGCIASLFKEQSILHQHADDGYIYTYPRVQYKVINGTAVIIGIEDATKAVKELSCIEKLKLGRSSYSVKELHIKERSEEFGVARESIRYAFLSPWLALNPKNYALYKGIREWRERKRFINNILVGNILSMSKGLDYIVRQKVHCHSLLNEENVTYKGVNVIAFNGEFKVNFKIPDYLGIGKGVSQGFGTVKRA